MCGNVKGVPLHSQSVIALSELFPNSTVQQLCLTQLQAVSYPQPSADDWLQCSTAAVEGGRWLNRQRGERTGAIIFEQQFIGFLWHKQHYLQ